VIVDLETTGGSPASSAITEIGAVKVRGGEPLGEFQTLVNPGISVPPFIAVLTGITDSMVASAPRLSAVLPTFLDWAAGSVLVAHNAPFDVGFLRAGATSLGLDWPGFDSVDTARLARRVLTRDEAPDCKLSTLSRLFRTDTTPCHRALADARATTEVLHGLLERLGNLGIRTHEELVSFTGLATAAQRRKRYLADGLPVGPGVYISRTRAAVRSTSAAAGTCGNGSGSTSLPPSHARGWPRWSVSPSRSTRLPVPIRSRPRSVSSA